MRRGVQRVLAALATVAVFLLCALAFITQASSGRAWVAHHVERLLSSAIAGDARIEELTLIRPDRVELRGLTFAAPNGDKVLRLDDVQLSPHWTALFHGAVGIDSARVRGGELTIRELENGDVPLEQAFASPNEGSKERSGGSGPRIALHGLRAEGLTVVINLAALSTMRVTEVNALVRIDLPPGEGVQVRFQNTEGTLHNHPLGDTAALSKVDGRVMGGATHVLDLQASVETEGEQFVLTIDYFDREKKPVRIRARNVEASWLGTRMKAMAAASGLVSTIDLRVNPEDEG